MNNKLRLMKLLSNVDELIADDCELDSYILLTVNAQNQIVMQYDVSDKDRLVEAFQRVLEALDGDSEDVPRPVLNNNLRLPGESDGS